jgi:nitroreductase
MELSEVVARRTMTRHFRAEPIESSTLAAVLKAALRAPSAGFSQGLDLLVLQDALARERFWRLSSSAQWRAGKQARGLLAAPVIVLPVADPSAYELRYREEDKVTSTLGGRAAPEWPVPYWLIDTAFAAMLVLLAAEDAGLGALFFQLHGEPDAVIQGLEIPTGRELIGAIALGYRDAPDPRTSPSRRRRRGYEEVVHLDQW